MRTWISVFLVALFAAVHTAAAFNVRHVEEQVLSQQSSIFRVTATATAVAGPHQMKCCEQSGKQDKFHKVSSCSIDCVSFLDTRPLMHPQVKIVPEHSQPPEFVALKPSPENRPPRQV
jgi:hypothetical protein